MRSGGDFQPAFSSARVALRKRIELDNDIQLTR